MLDMHAGLWAPGELHFANFDTMAERASRVKPVLRYMPIPEGAARCGASSAEFSRTFRAWELAATPITEVFQHLHIIHQGRVDTHAQHRVLAIHANLDHATAGLAGDFQAGEFLLGLLHFLLHFLGLLHEACNIAFHNGYPGNCY